MCAHESVVCALQSNELIANVQVRVQSRACARVMRRARHARTCVMQVRACVRALASSCPPWTPTAVVFVCVCVCPRLSRTHAVEELLATPTAIALLTLKNFPQPPGPPPCGSHTLSRQIFDLEPANCVLLDGDTALYLFR